MNIFIYFFVLILSLGYSLYTSEPLMGFSVLGFYLVGILLIRLITSSKSSVVYNLYTLFFVIYGALVLFTQIELIEDPYEDFFVHNDAALSFYTGVMNYVSISDWSSLLSSSILNPAFADYPLASLLFGTITKIGNDIGILDLRLFQRIHIFVLGAMTVAIIAETLRKWQFSEKEVRRFIIPFALCSYLFITSAIFSRDIHVLFLYTLVGYYMFGLEKQKVILPIIIVALLLTGMRPVNGILALLPLATVFYYKFSRYNPTVAKILIISFVGILFVLSGSIIEYGFRKLDFYNDLVLQNTGGIFIQLYTLPFPINQICMNIYQLLFPLPFDLYISNAGGSLLTLPFILSPYLMAMVFISTIWYIFKGHAKDSKFKLYLLSSVLMFVMINFVSPDLRRSFAVIPMVYMGYCLIYKDVPKKTRQMVKQVIWPCIILVNIFFAIYLYS